MKQPRIKIINHIGARDSSPNNVQYKGERYYIVDDFGQGVVYENADENKWVVANGSGGNIQGPFSTRRDARERARGA